LAKPVKSRVIILQNRHAGHQSIFHQKLIIKSRIAQITKMSIEESRAPQIGHPSPKRKRQNFPLFFGRKLLIKFSIQI
jgi:hypothetical protein